MTVHFTNDFQISSGRDFSECQTLEDLSSHHVSCVTVEDLYLFMGRELDILQEIPAGNVLGEFIIQSW